VNAFFLQGEMIVAPQNGATIFYTLPRAPRLCPHFL
jgi:hypothetical protein